MKKIVSLFLVFTLLFLFTACSNNDAGTNEKTQNKEWQIKYEEILQKCIDNGMLFGGVCVADTDGDGIPTVALVTNPHWFKIPHMILNYVDGNVVVQGEIEEVYSGTAIITEVYFIEGTNDFVFRSVGNTTGTFTANEYQRLYTLTPYGAFEESQKEFYITEDLEKEYKAGISEGIYDVSKYQDYIIGEMNRDLEDVYGNSVTLINFNDVVEVFTTESEEEISEKQQKAVEYLNQELGIDLTSKK